METLKWWTEICGEIFQRSKNEPHSLACETKHTKKPENTIIHCGTNDISKDVDPGKIAAVIINLSKSVSEE